MFDLLAVLGWNLAIAALLALVVWLAGRHRWLRSRPAVRHGLWLLVLLKLAAPPLLSVPILPARETASSSPPAVADATPLRAMADDGRTSDPFSHSDASSGESPSPSGAALVAARAAARPGMSASSAAPRSDWRFPVLFLTASLLGSLVILSLAQKSVLRTVRLLRPLQSAAAREAEIAAEVARRFGIRTAPLVYLTEAPVSPLLLGGVLRPRLVLPVSLVERLDDEQLRHVVAHELAHFVRRDHATNVLAFLVAAVFWWNPIAWLARREARIAAEACCDAMAIGRSGGSRKSYARTLLDAVDFVALAKPRSGLLTSFGESHSLKRRFEMIADSHVTARLPRSAWLVLAMGLLALALLPAQAQSQKPPAQQTAVENNNATATPADADAKQEDSKQEDAKAEKGKTDDRKPFVVEGRITDEAGRPLAGVEVTARCGLGTLVTTGTTTADENGRYTLRFGPGGRMLGSDFAPLGVGVQAATILPHLAGWYETNLHRQGGLLMADKPREKEARLQRGYAGVVLPGEPYRLDFVMAPGATIKGRLVNEFKRPVPGESVRLSGEELPPSQNVLASAETDAEGKFRFEGVPLKRKWRFALRAHGIRHELTTGAIELDEPGTAAYELILDSTPTPGGAVELTLSLRGPGKATSDVKINKATVEAGRAIVKGTTDPSHELVVRIERDEKPIEWRSGGQGTEFEVVVEASDKLTLEGGKTGHGFVVTTRRRDPGRQGSHGATSYVALTKGNPITGAVVGTFAVRREADFVTKDGVLTFADVILEGGKKLPVSLLLEPRKR